MKKFYDTLSSSVLSGIAISIGCITYLKVGGVAGACLFAFGLLCVVHHGWKLFTGRSGFVYDWGGLLELPLVLVGNIIGCFLMSLMAKEAMPQLMENAVAIANSRIGLGLAPCLLMGIGCGFIMTTAVHFGKEGKYLPLLFGVPVFILCGFLHSIADAFYLSMLPYGFMEANAGAILKTYLMVVVGNFIGCNLVRILKFKKIHVY